MTSHALAKKLLSLPNLPVATHANNHTFDSMSTNLGRLKVGRLRHYNGEHLIIGNYVDRLVNCTNWSVLETYE